MRLKLDSTLFQTGDRVLAAVSGGTDSLALLHLLHAQREQLGIELLAAHVHHGMRGEDADADARFLEETCREWGVPLTVEQADVPRLARERGVSVEEAGRIARYDAFARAAREAGCGKIATAHTADDQVETVLMNLFRGAGVDGLAGIPLRRPLNARPGAPEVVRPLLGVWRRELEAYCAAHGLIPRDDSTNRDTRYLRSRIRYELLPLLQPYDPRLKEHLVRLARQAREEAELLGSEAEALLQAALQPECGFVLPFRPPPGRVPALTLDRLRLAAAPPALLRRALRAALRQVAGYAVELDAEPVERLVRLVYRHGASAWDLPGAPFRARVAGECLLLERTLPAPEPPAPRELALPGRTGAPEFGLTLNAVECTAPADPRLPSHEALLDAASLRPPLCLRSPRTGDRFRPLGAPGSRLLGDLLAERRVPRGLRPFWPLVTDQEGILWVVGLAVAERARVSEATAGCVRFRASPLAA